MASGDTVFQATGMEVAHSMSGKGPRRKFTTASSDGYEAGLQGQNSNSHDSFMYDLVVYGETSPFDPAKTYDVTIKEH
jgi:hypothetical protein